MSKALGKAGVETTLISAGKYKTEGNPFVPLGSAARRHLQNRVDDYYRKFVGSVAKHRGVDTAAVREGMGQGRLLHAQVAKAESMVDDVMTFDKVLRKLVQRADRSSTKPARTPAASLPQTRTASSRREVDMLNI